MSVLGDGNQRKSYLHIGDCVSALLHVVRAGTAAKAKHCVQVYNLGTAEYCQVRDSIAWISARLGVSPRIEFSGGDRGWVGDNPFIFLDTAKVLATGWRPKLGIREGVELTVDWLAANEWIFSKRA